MSRNCYMALLLLVLNACATTEPVLEQQVMEMEGANHLSAEKAWYAVRFSILWDKALEPDWYLGTLIAGEVIDPVLEQSQQKIAYWRVHRRAVDDKTGHVFSFIFYTTQAEAANIYQQFEHNESLASLVLQGQLIKVTYDSLYNNSLTKIADTSDPIWPEQIRSSWPYFMMGVSQMWLEQIRALQEETLNEPDIRQRYIIIQSKITELWQQQGQHALLHHLSALYAYEPLLTRF